MKPLSRNKAARLIGISPSTLLNMERRGTGPSFVRLDGVCLYDVEKINAWLAQRTVGGAA